MMTFTRKALSIAVMGLLPSAMAVADPAVESIATIRSKVAKAGDTGSMRVRGFVTFAMPVIGLAFVQDETAGLAFYPRGLADAQHPLKSGDVVELTGVPMSRDGMLMLCGEGSTKEHPRPPVIQWLDPEMKVRPRPFDLSYAAEIRVNAELIHSNGIVRRVTRPAHAGMIVEVSSLEGYVIVRLPWTAEEEEVKSWLNQEAAFNGVVVCRADKRLLPEDADAVVFVPSLSQWQLRPSIMNAVFAKPPVSASQIGRSLPVNRPTGRLHVDGHVTAVRKPSTLFLRTDDGSVEISTRQAEEFHEGEKISVACRLLNKQGRLVLADGVCRSLGKTASVNPVEVKSAMAAIRAGYGELVQFNGRVRDVFRDRAQGRLLVALDNGGTCAVRWEPPVTMEALEGAGIGAVLKLTGICQTGKAADLGANFTLHPRSDADLQLLSTGPWWTRQRLSRALWTLVILTGIAVPGSIFLRWKLWKQEQKIREIERAAASAEERQRIAREFHDSLQQQLCSASLHVENLRYACESAPEMLPGLLDDVSTMLRNCQVETRNSIWDLRADGEFREGLAPSLRSWLSMRQRMIPDTRLDFEMEGEEGERLPATTCLQVFRIVQEAVNNAVAHAAAKRVLVRLKAATQSLEILVSDDGKGFNTSSAPAAAEGHYGLGMLQERAQRIRARVDLRSEKNRGTWVRLIVPYAASCS